MRRDCRGFMLSVPLTSRPRTKPDPKTTQLDHTWQPGNSCGGCSNCCHFGGHACPLLDQASGRCQGYDSFYWRYFNCGRFPTLVEEIDYYDCRKWVLIPSFVTSKGAARGQGASISHDDRPRPVDPPG